MSAFRSLKGKTCVITGASSGIGRAIATAFAQDGARCILIGRNTEKLQGVLRAVQEPVSDAGAAVAASDAKARHDPGQSHAHAIYEMDVRLPDAWKTLVKEHNHADVLVNCAGVTQAALLSRMDVEQVEDLINTNLRSAILGSKVYSKRMLLAKQGGCIINISSLLARKGTPGTSVYAATKAALLGLTSSLAVELGRGGIRVNALVPGYIDTPMVAGLTLNAEDTIKRIPLGRFGTPEEVADAALFLAKNPYANNCVLNLDGGLSAT